MAKEILNFTQSTAPTHEIPFSDHSVVELRRGENSGELGRGAFAAVHACQVVVSLPLAEVAHTLEFAQKVPTSEQKSQESIANEVEVYQGLQQAGKPLSCVVTAHVVNEKGLLLEHMAKTLATRFNEDPPPSGEEAKQMLIQLFQGIAEMHTAGYVHGDITFDNVMLTKEGAVKVGDMGCAQKAGEVNQRPINYAVASPNQWRGLVHNVKVERAPSDDLFSLGVLLHQVLEGGRPGFIDATTIYNLDSFIEKRNALLQGLSQEQREKIFSGEEIERGSELATIAEDYQKIVESINKFFEYKLAGVAAFLHANPETTLGRLVKDLMQNAVTLEEAIEILDKMSPGEFKELQKPPGPLEVGIGYNETVLVASHGAIANTSREGKSDEQFLKEALLKGADELQAAIRELQLAGVDVAHWKDGALLRILQNAKDLDQMLLVFDAIVRELTPESEKKATKIVEEALALQASTEVAKASSVALSEAEGIAQINEASKVVVGCLENALGQIQRGYRSPKGNPLTLVNFQRFAQAVSNSHVDATTHVEAWGRLAEAYMNIAENAFDGEQDLRASFRNEIQDRLKSGQCSYEWFTLFTDRLSFLMTEPRQRDSIGSHVSYRGDLAKRVYNGKPAWHTHDGYLNACEEVRGSFVATHFSPLTRSRSDYPDMLLLAYPFELNARQIVATAPRFHDNHLWPLGFTIDPVNADGNNWLPANFMFHDDGHYRIGKQAVEQLDVVWKTSSENPSGNPESLMKEGKDLYDSTLVGMEKVVQGAIADPDRCEMYEFFCFFVTHESIDQLSDRLLHLTQTSVNGKNANVPPPITTGYGQGCYSLAEKTAALVSEFRDETYFFPLLPARMQELVRSDANKFREECIKYTDDFVTELVNNNPELVEKIKNWRERVNGTYSRCRNIINEPFYDRSA
ncbi:MAG: protein kinase [Verrucomicrobia bacterium]|nr:protein kinase [Verrucomicrobiota bacterium]